MLDERSSQLKRVGASFVAERMRRLIEVASCDTKRSVFYEWYVYCLTSITNKERALISTAAQGLESQVATGSKQGGLKILQQLMKRRQHQEMIRAVFGMKLNQGLDAMQRRVEQQRQDEFRRCSPEVQAGALISMPPEQKARMLHTLPRQQRAEVLAAMSDGGSTIALLPPEARSATLEATRRSLPLSWPRAPPHP